MQVIFILILISSVVASVFVAAFVWSVKSGQFDDTYSPSVRLLFENPDKKEPKNVDHSREGKDSGDSNDS